MLGKTVLPEGELHPCEAVALELPVGPRAVPIRVPPPRPRGLLVKVPSRRACWKVRGQEVSPRRRWLLRESAWRTRNSCGQGPRRLPVRSEVPVKVSISSLQIYHLLLFHERFPIIGVKFNFQMCYKIQLVYWNT